MAASGAGARGYFVAMWRAHATRDVRTSGKQPLPPLVRVVVLGSALACATGLGPVSAQTFQTVAPFALVEDYDSGSVLFEKNSDELMPPASTSKLIVAEIVFRELKEGRLKLDDKFRVSDYAWRTGGARTHGSTMFLRVKSEVRIEDLIRGLVIQSGNDAAITLAEGLGGTEDNFVALMNKRAAELGMAHSHFTNAWGRSDPGERVNARDMAKLAAWIIRTYPENYHYFGEKDFTWDKIRQPNRNPLLAMNIGADGLKTGDTAESGYGLVGAAVQDGQRLIVVVNGLKTASDRAEESRKMFNWAFRAFESRVLFASGDTVGTAEVFGGATSEIALTSASPVKVFVPRASTERLSAKIVYDGPLVAPVAEGVAVGALKVYHGQTLMLELPLQTKGAAPLGSLSKRALDAAMELGGDWIRQVFHAR